MAERIQKILAEAGIGSRRQIETMIRDLRVSVNGKLSQLGDKAELNDTIRVDGRIIRLHERPDNKQRVVIYNKPEGEICSRSDPEGRPTIYRAMPKLRSGRWISVGRLDINTNGLILLTTDGELANRLMHPSMEVEREYAVRVRGEVSPEMIKRLQAGVMLEDGIAKFESVRLRGGEGQNVWYHVTLKRGKNREVRRLWESQEIMVSRLTRVRYGNIELPRGLKPGKWVEVNARMIDDLRVMAGLEPLLEPLLPKLKDRIAQKAAQARGAGQKSASRKPDASSAKPSGRDDKAKRGGAGAHKSSSRKPANSRSGNRPTANKTAGNKSRNGRSKGPKR